MRLCCLVTGFAVILAFSALARAAPARVVVYDFEIDCTFFRGDPEGTSEQFASPAKVTKSGEEGSFSDLRQLDTGGQVLRVGREVRVAAFSQKGNRILIEATLGLAEVVGPNNLPARHESRGRTSAIVQPGGTVTIQVESQTKEKHWVEIRVRKVKR